MKYEDCTHELSIAPGRADTLRSELHTVAASRGRFIRRINALVHDDSECAVPVGFSLVLYLVYQVPGTRY